MSEKLDLDAIERLLKDSTEGPWELFTEGPRVLRIDISPELARSSFGVASLKLDSQFGLIHHGILHSSDAKLIVALRNAAPQMLSRLRALERVAAAAKDASRLRLFISTYSGRALDQPRGLAILDALDKALKEAGL